MNKHAILLATLFLCSAPLYQAAEKPAVSTKKATAKKTANKKNAITFHESWTEQQRADIQHMYKLLSVDLPAEMHGEQASPIEKAAARATIAPMLKVLTQSAATGRGDIYGKDGISLAWLAIRLGKPQMVKELVRRGTNPNQQMKFLGTEMGEDLISSIIAQSPVSETVRMIPEEYAELLQWLLENGADPNKSHPHMLNICCQKEMFTYNRCTCTTLVLDKINSLTAEQQADLATTMLRNIPDSGAAFEHFFKKGLFTQKGVECNESVFFVLGMDAPEKMEKLIDMGFDPNYIPPLRDRKEFDRDSDYEDYLSDYCGDTPPLVFLIDNLGMMGITDEDLQKVQQIRLQCIEIILRHGATAELYESDLPTEEPLRTKLTALLKQYNVPVLPDEVDEEEYEDDEDTDEEYDDSEEEEYTEDDEEEYSEEDE